MCIYDYDYRTKQEVEKDQKNYNLQSLVSSLSRLEEVTREINHNLATRKTALLAQIEKVEKTEFRPFVLVSRGHTYEGKVTIEVYLRQIPNIPFILDQINSNETLMVWRSLPGKKERQQIPVRRGDVMLEHILKGYEPVKDYWFPIFGKKVFGGTERKKALTYAQELAQEHKATVVKAGF